MSCCCAPPHSTYNATLTLSVPSAYMLGMVLRFLCEVLTTTAVLRVWWKTDTSKVFFGKGHDERWDSLNLQCATTAMGLSAFYISPQHRFHGIPLCSR